MLGQHKKHTVPEWSIILIAALLLLVAVSIFVRTTGSTLNLNLLERDTQPQIGAESIAQPAVEVLRAAKPDYSGAFLPESTMSREPVSVEILRATKPEYSGAVIPETTMGREPVSVEILRATKSDYSGGFVPESTMGD